MERYLSRMPQAGWLDALGARAAILLGCEGLVLPVVGR